jgi:hypothetical protein
MLLGMVLLYVGAVLAVNGIWLIGQARVAGAGDGGGTVAADAHPTFIQGREVAVLNIFTGFVGVLAAIVYAVQGNQKGDLVAVRAGALILLFAFTYLWVAANAFLNAGGRAFGWYCLFVAITAVATGVWTWGHIGGSDVNRYLGVDWFAWAVLWGMFFVLLALDRPIGRITGAVALLEGIGTAWVLGFLLLFDLIH